MQPALAARLATYTRVGDAWRRRLRTVRGVVRHGGRGIELLEPRHLLAGVPVITEFMAKNDGLFEDGDGKSPDWIEIQNIGDTQLDLAGYRLTDTARDASRWAFPSVTVDPGEYLVVFASGRDEDDYVDAGGNLHTNFSLSAGGEYLALTAPDGTTLSEFGDAQSNYVAQEPNVSYGAAQRLELVDEQTDITYWVPTDARVDSTWMQNDFDSLGQGFVTGKAALGFEGRPSISLDYGPEILSVLSSEPTAVYARIEFDLEDSSDVDRLNLQMKYDDGFVAYLNGVKIVEDNAPADLNWSSTATRRHSDRRALNFVDFDLRDSIPYLIDGTNVLAIHGLNFATDLRDMLLVPRLVASLDGVDSKIGYMATATPGEPNVSSEFVYSGLLSEAEVSVESGFFDSSFLVTVSSETPGTEIRYTTDGSPPTQTTGIAYVGPIQIETTTTLRTAVFFGDRMPSNITTRSYLFLQDVIRQSADQPGLPTRWQQFDADYGMDQSIVDAPAYRDEIVDGLRSIRTMSIVMDPDDFFGPNGIYVKTGGRGVESERPVSVEIINPDGTLAVRVNAGLRNNGNRTRDFNVTLKQSFRLVFNARYGPTKLEYPLFSDSPVKRFDNIVLHAGKLLDDPQLIRNSFSRDTNRAMGNVESHSTYVHLYLNGLYWGLYNPFERADAQFAEEYFGGTDEDYDSVLNNTERVDGDSIRYTAMWRLLRTGVATQEEYEEFRRQIDLNSLFDLLLINQYMAHDEYELRAIGNRDGDPNFRFFVQDMDEGGMKSVTIRKNVANFLPGRSYQQLIEHPEARMLYADRAQKHLFNDGALTPEQAAKRWGNRAQEIESAVIAETARWGDTHWRRVFPRKPVERDVEMRREQDFLSERFFPQRTQVLIDQLRSLGVYPDVDAPVLNQFGGPVLDDFQLTMTHPNDEGTILYTLDGTDPRQFGGETSPVAIVYDGSPISFSRDSVVKARVISGEEWSALSDAQFLVIPADSNADGQINASDIDAFCAGINQRNSHFDLDRNGSVDQDDLAYFLRTVLNTNVGDTNLDGAFNEGDFQIAEFEDDLLGNSTWADGDRNCDREFTSADIVLALRTGQFEIDAVARAAVALDDAALDDVATRLAHHRFDDSESFLQIARVEEPRQWRSARVDRTRLRLTQTHASETVFSSPNAFARPEMKERRDDLFTPDNRFDQANQVEDLLADLL